MKGNYMTDDTTANTNTAPEANAADESADFTVNDLSAIKSIIDVASARGAFKPNEMVPVGTIYNKLEKFLAAAQQAQQTNA
jgi:hypothetical protein